MKIVFIVLSVLSFSFAYKDCSIVAPRKVICHGEKGQISIFLMKNDRNFIGKTYFPEDKNGLSEAVITGDYGIIDTKPICLSSLIYMLKDSASTPKEVFDEIDSVCSVIEEGLFKDIEKGVVREIGEFKESIGTPRMMGLMECRTERVFDYVSTVKYNQVTGLRTDLREYKALKHGTYCKDFLATDELFWSPSK